MDLDPSSRADAGFGGKLTQGTRRSFIKGIAAAGASTMAAYAIDSGGALDMFTDEARAATVRDTTPFMDFEAIAASSADQVEVPAGFRADVLIRYGDQFTDAAGKELTFGYNNDYLAFFPIEGSSDEGILFVNHEYPGPFFMNGYKATGVEQPGGSASHDKSTADIREERKSVGNSFLHIARGTDGIWGVVEGSEFNRRIYGDSPIIPMTGPLAKPTSEGGVGTTSNGSLANCSGGITPWGTALSCEENYDGYGIPLGSQDFFYGWDNVDGLRYDQNANKTYGWVVEHDPYDPEDVGRKHTALGRFRHENTAFRVVPDKPFVLYMGDDANNEGVYKFVSDREFDPADTDAARANNMQILSEGTLYIAEWTRNDNTTLGAGRTVYTSEGGPRAASSPSEGPRTLDPRRRTPTSRTRGRSCAPGTRAARTSSATRRPPATSTTRRGPTPATRSRSRRPTTIPPASRRTARRTSRSTTPARCTSR
jgi:secreted PhoX family phosphatase